VKSIFARSLIISGAIVALSGKYALAQSQIVPDSTLGAESSTVIPAASDSTVDNIQGGAIRDTNLFHSFQEFNVGEGRSAYFLSSNSNIQNILARVTGGNLSEILGTLGTGGASSINLFLINPNGIIFGQNARLDLGGSFVASTASSLKFANGIEFSATEPQTIPLLTVSVPTGLQFGDRVERIVNQSYTVDNLAGLQVKPEKTLALVGGEVRLDGGNLTAESGRIELGSVGDSSLVSLTPTAQGWALGYEGVQNFGDIQLSQEAFVDASGEAGGTIQVQGRRVELTDASVIQAFTTRSLSGGTFTVNASDSLELVGSVINEGFVTSSSLRSGTLGSGSAGNLSISTKKLILKDGAEITTATSSTGKGGDLQINATESVKLSGVAPDGFSSGLFANTRGEGNGGNITVDTGNLQVTNGAVVSARTISKGNAGNITLKANTVEAIRGGQILAATQGSGNAGNINLDISNSITLSGNDPTFFERAEQLARNGDFVNNVSPDSGLFANTTEESTGNGGNVTLKTGQLNVSDGAELAVSSQGSGNAGDFQIQADSISLENQGKLTAAIASSGQGGGNIILQDLDLLLLRGNSEISTNAQGTSNGGDIKINTDLLTGTENSRIIAKAVEGRGGIIRITTQGLFLSPDSIIDASSERGINGIVEINRPDVDPSADVVVLPAQIINVSGLVAQGCPAGGGNLARGTSEFVVTGRGGLPPTPAEATRSDTTLADLGTPVQREKNRLRAAIPINSTTTNSAPLVEAQGWVINSQGEVILTANVPNVTPDIPWLTPTSCNKS
jgi:filamentous hemagglutinin family protein